jgi:hypothetical protein
MTELNRKIDHGKHAIPVVLGNPLRSIGDFPWYLRKTMDPP